MSAETEPWQPDWMLIASAVEALRPWLLELQASEREALELATDIEALRCHQGAARMLRAILETPAQVLEREQDRLDEEKRREASARNRRGRPIRTWFRRDVRGGGSGGG